VDKILLERLYRTTKIMDVKWSLGVPTEGDDIVPCGDYRASCVEHVCHELAHALLLRLPLEGKNLSGLIGALLDKQSDRRSHLPAHHRNGWSANETNEIHTFAVTIMAMRMMGFEIDEVDGVLTFADACEVQTGGPRVKIMQAFACYWQTKRCETLAKRIVREFKKLQKETAA
jgi:hypothetical protein